MGLIMNKVLSIAEICVVIPLQRLEIVKNLFSFKILHTESNKILVPGGQGDWIKRDSNYLLVFSSLVGCSKDYMNFNKLWIWASVLSIKLFAMGLTILSKPNSLWSVLVAGDISWERWILDHKILSILIM